jgi:hypothetical protein
MKPLFLVTTHLLLAVAMSLPGLAAGESESDKQIAALTNKLDRIIIPEDTIPGETLEECIEYLRVRSRELDKEPDPTKRGVNFVIIGSAEHKRGGRIGLPLKNVPLSEVVRGETDLCGMSFVIEPHAMVIHPAKYSMINPVPKYKFPSSLELRLARQLIPTVQFQDALVEEAVEYLHISRGCLDESAITPAQPQHINIILKAGAFPAPPTFSLDLKNVPRGEALRYIAELAGLKLRFHAHAVVISPVDDALDAPILIESKGIAKALADKLIIPKIEFQNATLRDAIDFVRIKSRELDPDKKGTQITVGPGVELTRTIDLTLKSMPASELLRYCAALTGHRLSVDDRAFNMRPK